MASEMLALGFNRLTGPLNGFELREADNLSRLKVAKWQKITPFLSR